MPAIQSVKSWVPRRLVVVLQLSSLPSEFQPMKFRTLAEGVQIRETSGLDSWLVDAK